MGDVLPIDSSRYQAATIRRAVAMVRDHSDPIVHDLLEGIENAMLSALNVLQRIKRLEDLVDE